ncbi:MAG: TetR/AcrR family transcriptional regulator [Bacteroidales bacterium]|nr:TetR/AcrR family transcriptional regulator [Bacteroidales bacterium]MCF8455263.1 TetR/AcrR family transcriptional regulator [Bacteroidales bacterium]
MSPRTKQQFETIREGRKDQIMQVALELFANEGINTPISKIAKEAGISKGLMYNYFESKDELLREVALSGMKEIFDLFDPNHDGVLTDEEFVYFISETFRLLEKNREYWKLYFSMVLHPKVMELIQAEMMEMLPGLMAVQVKYFASKGSKDPETDAMFFNSMMDGIGMNYVNNPDLFNLDKIKNRIIEIFTKNL